MRRALVIVLGSLLACDGSPPQPTVKPEHAGEPTPQRIVSFVPNLTEILFALGQGHRLVGRTDFCKWPPEAQEIPSVGGLLNISWEQVRAMEPDLAVFHESNQDLYRPLAAMDVETLAVRSETMDEVRTAIQSLADRLGVAEQGEDLIGNIDAALAVIARRLAGLESRRTLLLIGREPGSWQSLFAAGPSSFVSELAVCAGAVNVLEETLGPFPPISREIIVAANPEVIIDTVFEHTGATPQLVERERRLYQESLPTVDAVATDRVIFWDDPHLTIPGPAMAEQVEKLAHAIHPEAFE